MHYVDSILGHHPRLGEWLGGAFEEADSVAIRTGFLSAPAVKELKEPFAAFLERNGRLLIVAGGAPEQADPVALVELADLLRPYPRAALRVVVHPEEFQNAKTYHLTFRDGHQEALIGSPNLTIGGMRSNHEAAILLDSRHEGDDEVIGAILRGIEAFRDRPGATPISPDVQLILARRQAASVRRSTATSTKPMSPPTQLGELLQPALDRVDEIASGGVAGLPTGFTELDEITGGLGAGTLTAIAGRPGIGSSTLLLDIVRYTALRRGERAAFYCLDRNTDEILIHILSAEAKVRRSDMRTGRMNDDDWTRLAARMSELTDTAMLINTTPGANLSALCAQITQLHHAEPLALVAIDPMNMIDPALAEANRERELSTVSRRLKLLALELQIPIVVTAEIGRAVEYRTDKRPIMSDLRDSDTLAQVADIVILLNRPDAYDMSDPRGGEADLYLVKQRNGPLRTITLAHQLHIGRFANLAR